MNICDIGYGEVIMSDEISMSKEMLNQLQSFDWKVYLPTVKSKRSCLITVTDRLVTFDTGTDKVSVVGGRSSPNAYFIALDPSIGWHRELIELQLLEEL